MENSPQTTDIDAVPASATTPTSPQTLGPPEVISDPAVRFRGLGTNFKAKLIGIDDVPDSRGDKMCQDSILKLKAAVKASGQHKQKIVINVSLEGIKIVDVMTGEVHHVHPVHRISFISRDLTDRRAFGYVYGVGEGKHQFFGVKTAKVAEVLVLALRDLFQVVYDLKKKEMEDAKTIKVNRDEPQERKTENVYSVPHKPVSQQPAIKQQQSNDSLLDLEQQLTNIQEGINNIDSFSPWPQDLPTSPDTPGFPQNGDGSNSDLFGIALIKCDKPSHILPLLPPPPSKTMHGRGECGRRRNSPYHNGSTDSDSPLSKVEPSDSFSSTGTYSSSRSTPTDDQSSYFSCSSGGAAQTRPENTANYSAELFSLSAPAAQPAPQPGAKLTKDQILSGYGPGGAQQGMFPGQPQMMMQPGMQMPGQYGAQPQMAPGFQQQMPGFGQAPAASAPFGMFPSGPSPAIPPRPGAMRPPAPQVVPGGAPQNPFGDAAVAGGASSEVLAPINPQMGGGGGGDAANGSQSAKKQDPFANLIPGIGGASATSKKDMFKNFEMAKPPQPPPRTNPPVSSGAAAPPSADPLASTTNGFGSTTAPSSQAPAQMSDFDNYFLNSVGGVPIAEDSPKAPVPAPRQQDASDPFGMGLGDMSAAPATGGGADPFSSSNQGFSDPFQFNQTNGNTESLFG